MQPRPSFDRELLIPIAVAVVSILGLAWIFLTNYRGESLNDPTPEPTLIPFDASPIATRTRFSLPSRTPSEEETPTATATRPESYPGPPVETLPSTGTLITESSPLPSATPTPAGKSFPPGRYDDTDPNITYDRFWVFRMNTGTKFAYKGTLHTSNNIGNELSFLFTGQQLTLGYQRGRSFGIVTVIIDDQTYSFHEQAFGNVWHSPELSPGTHFVRLIHESGESVNLDYIEIPR